MHLSNLTRRLLRHFTWLLVSCLAVVPAPAQAAEDGVEIEGEVVTVADGRVRVELGAVPPDAPPAPGDPVSFYKMVDGFELDAGSGVVDEVGAGFVWVAEVDSRVAPGVEARIQATKGPGPRTGSPAAASDDEELERVMRRHWQAMGGDAWDDVESLRVSGQENSGDKKPIHFRFTWKRPDSFGIEMARVPIKSREDVAGVLVSAGGKTIVKSENGSIEQGTVGDYHSIDPFFRLEEPLSHWRSMGLEIRFEGREEMRGVPVYHVRVRMNDTELSYFVDAETYRLAHTLVRSPDENLWWSLRSYDGYEPADGVMIPRSISKSIQSEPNQPPLVIERTIRRVEVDVDVPDSFFRRP